MTHWPFRKIYLYAVCLISILFILFNIYAALDNFVNALYPGYYGPPPLEMYGGAKLVPGQPAPSPEALAAQQRYQEEQKRDNQRRELARGVARLGATLLVALPVFLFHWRQTRPDD